MSHDHAPRQVADARAPARAEAARPAPPLTPAHAVPSPDETVTDAPSAFAGPARSDRLPPALQHQMGAAFGLDLAAVPVIARSPAAEAHHAEAIATGGALHFAPGRYDPSSSAGRALIGHEVAHLRQQTDGRADGVQARRDGGVLDPLEREADVLGGRAARGEVGLYGDGPPRPPRATAMVQRKPTLWTEIESTPPTPANPTGKVKWEPHRTAIEASGKSYGTGASFHAKTTIAYGGLGRAAIKKGVYAGGKAVIAEALGPKHPPGAPLAPTWTTPAALDHVVEDAAAAKNKTAPTDHYKAVQLLPAALGGDGTAQNAIALPPEAARKLEARVHTPLTQVVNGDHATVDYRVWIDEDLKDGTPYVKKVKAGWGQLDAANKPIPATQGKYETDVPSPAERAEGGAARTTSKAKPAPGLHATARRAEWKTEITFGPVNAEQDGTKMVAHPLGPDHKVGDQPAKNTPGAKKPWNLRTAELKKASGGKMNYIAGHLLNHHLGGPGDDARNLAPIPADANDLHESQVESIIKDLVNHRGAWVHYEVVVQFKNDNIGTATLPKWVNYPSAFVCRWWQLDAANQPIPNTLGHRIIGMEAPTKYAVAPIASGKTLPSLAETTDVQLDPKHKTLQDNTARTVLGYDEVLLEDANTLKSQVAVMRPLIKKLHELGLHQLFATNGALEHNVFAALRAITPSADEVEARTKIETLTQALRVHTLTPGSTPESALPTINELEQQLTAFHGEFLARHGRSVAAIGVLYKHYDEAKAKAFGDELQVALAQGVRDVDLVTKVARAVIDSARTTTSKFMDSDSALRSLEHVTTTTFKGKPLDDGAGAQQRAMHGAQTVQAAREKLDRNIDKKRKAEGELRHAAWLTSNAFGQPLADQRAKPKELRKHVQSTLFAAQEQEGKRHQQVSTITRLSPNQALELHKTRFAGTRPVPPSGIQAQHELIQEQLASHETIDEDEGPAVQGRRKRVKAVPEVDQGADALLALVKKVVEDGKQPWPKADDGSGLDGDARIVATTVENLVGSFGSEAPTALMARSLYQTHTAAFNAYLAWVKTKVTS